MKNPMIKRTIIFFFYCLFGCLLGWLYVHSQTFAYFWVYFLSLFLFGMSIGLIFKKMVFYSYGGVVLGQTFYMLVFAEASAFMGIVIIFLFLYSVLVLFANAVGAVIAEKYKL